MSPYFYGNPHLEYLEYLVINQWGWGWGVMASWLLKVVLGIIDSNYGE